METVSREQAMAYAEAIGTEGLNLIGHLHENKDCVCLSTKQGNGLVLLDGYCCRLHAKENAFIDDFKAEYAGKEFFFSQLPRTNAEYLLGGRITDWTSQCYILHYPMKKVETANVPVGIEVSELKVSDAKEVNFYYTYKGEGTEERIASEIAKRPSSAVRVGGELAAWNLLHDDYAMGAMFVKPQYRGLGYATIAAQDLMNKVIKAGMTPYIQVIQTNKASLGLAAKLGFKLSHEAIWFETEI